MRVHSYEPARRADFLNTILLGSPLSCNFFKSNFEDEFAAPRRFRIVSLNCPENCKEVMLLPLSFWTTSFFRASMKTDFSLLGHSNYADASGTVAGSCLSWPRSEISSCVSGVNYQIRALDDFLRPPFLFTLTAAYAILSKCAIWFGEAPGTRSRTLDRAISVISASLHKMSDPKSGNVFFIFEKSKLANRRRFWRLGG